MTLVDTQAAAVYVEKATGQPCSPVTIRGWAHEGRITRRGRKFRRTLYALEDIDAVLAARDVGGR